MTGRHVPGSHRARRAAPTAGAARDRASPSAAARLVLHDSRQGCADRTQALSPIGLDEHDVRGRLRGREIQCTAQLLDTTSCRNGTRGVLSLGPRPELRAPGLSHLHLRTPSYPEVAPPAAIIGVIIAAIGVLPGWIELLAPDAPVSDRELVMSPATASRVDPQPLARRRERHRPVCAGARGPSASRSSGFINAAATLPRAPAMILVSSRQRISLTVRAGIGRSDSRHDSRMKVRVAARARLRADVPRREEMAR